MSVKAIPEDFATVTPTLIVNDAAKAIETYKKAFGASEEYRMNCPNSGKIMHACIKIGSSKVFLSDVNPQMGCAATTSSFYTYFSDVDAIFKQAKQAGLQEKSAPQDMFWGDRTGVVSDAFGNNWTIATHVRDVSPQEMEEARKKMAAKAA
jgi:PhnB protein